MSRSCESTSAPSTSTSCRSDSRCWRRSCWLRRRGLLRPADAPVISWESILFQLVRWPWALIGCVNALWGAVTGREDGFKVTPKRAGAEQPLPLRVIVPYLVLSAISILPVLLVSDPGSGARLLLLGAAQRRRIPGGVDRGRRAPHRREPGARHGAVDAAVRRRPRRPPSRSSRPGWYSPPSFTAATGVDGMTWPAPTTRRTRAARGALAGRRPEAARPSTSASPPPRWPTTDRDPGRRVTSAERQCVRACYPQARERRHVVRRLAAQRAVARPSCGLVAAAREHSRDHMGALGLDQGRSAPRSRATPCATSSTASSTATSARWARALAAFGGPVRLRFAQEMNGDWYPWGAGTNGNTPAEFVRAWRHVHDIFTAAGATNVQWVWSPVSGAPAAVLPGRSVRRPARSHLPERRHGGLQRGMAELRRDLWPVHREVARPGSGACRSNCPRSRAPRREVTRPPGSRTCSPYLARHPEVQVVRLVQPRQADELADSELASGRAGAQATGYRRAATRERPAAAPIVGRTAVSVRRTRRRAAGRPGTPASASSRRASARTGSRSSTTTSRRRADRTSGIP